MFKSNRFIKITFETFRVKLVRSYNLLQILILKEVFVKIESFFIENM